MFLLGSPTNPGTEHDAKEDNLTTVVGDDIDLVDQQLKEEAYTHNDIVQGNFLDTYYNLTLKGVVGLSWISRHCPSAGIVIKIDDDVYVNVFRIVDFVLPALSGKRHQIGCPYHPAGQKPILRQGAKWGSKWTVESHIFPHLRTYPVDHCDGFFVVMTGDLIEPMLEAVRVNPFFHIDDIYMYGLLPRSVGDVKFTDLTKFVTSFVEYGQRCLKSTTCRLLAVIDDNYDRKSQDHMEMLAGGGNNNL